MEPAQNLTVFLPKWPTRNPHNSCIASLHGTRTVPAHDFYLQTSKNILKLCLINCKGPA